MKTLRLFGLACSLLVAATFANADTWKFIVTGDGRSDTGHPRVGVDRNGVNVKAMSALARAVVAEKAKFVLFSGDLVAGPKTDAEMESQLRSWLDVMKPVYAAGIKVYAIRGNHEMHCPHPADVWRKVFRGPYAMPSNGPAGEEEVNFTVHYENALIVGLDEFMEPTAHVNQKWLDGVLKGKSEQHLFLTGHKMAFKSGHHVDGLDGDPAARDAFWKSIAAAGGRTFFAGHDHLYDHLEVRSPDGSIDVHQFVVGTAGAPFAHGDDHQGNNSDWQLKQLSHVEDKVGYLVVEVDGPKVTLTFKGEDAAGSFQPLDAWSYTVATSR